MKKVIIRSGGPERRVNIRILVGLMHELRIKLDYVKAGLAAEKTMRLVNQGLDDPQKDKAKMQLKRKQRIERMVLREFNLINLSRVQTAIQDAS